MKVVESAMYEDEQQVELERQLEQLKKQHKETSDLLEALLVDTPYDQLRIQRLKKQKLMLKDQIAQIYEMLYPDIIA